MSLIHCSLAHSIGMGMRLLAIGWGSKESVNLATPTEYRNGHDDEYGDNLAFRVFEFDTQGVELRRSGVPIKLRDQSSRILVYLLEHAGQMVTREELRQYLWPSDTFVDFDHSLNTAVMKLREALGDSVDKPLYIETIPLRPFRRGGIASSRRYRRVWRRRGTDLPGQPACRC
jgi:DNA-binding winged helix-turn-helix (wHTH) protein